MSPEISYLWQRLKYLSQISPKVMVRRLLSKIVVPIYRHEVGYITVGPNNQRESTVAKHSDNKGTEFAVFKTPESLLSQGYEIPPLIPVSELERHLKEDPSSVVIIASRANSDGSRNKIIGYATCQQGIFYAPGIEGKLPPDFLFIINGEVIPECRGQRVAEMMWDATDRYCIENGYKKRIGVILSHNQPALRYHMRLGTREISGKVEFLSLFSGLYTKATPMDEIRKMIETAASNQKGENGVSA